MAYNREKTLAIVTGIVCALIFCAGTALGSYHAIITIGAFAGMLATACYLIGDIAIAWAAYIDYQEDGNAMEWASWAVKYGLSFYLLFSGGCIAYMLFNDGATQTGRTATMKRASEAQATCLKNTGANGAKVTNAAQAACRKVYEAQLSSETATDKEKEGNRVKWVDDFTTFPLFNYIPGILGLASLLLITFVSKLSKGSARSGGNELEFNTGTVRMSSAGGRSNFTLPAGETESLPRVSNGQQSFRFKPQGSRYAVNWRSNGRERYGVMVTPDKARSLAGLSYADVARFVIGHRRAGDANDGLSREIEASI